MIKTLYPCFQRWSEKGSVYLISDTNFYSKKRKLLGYKVSEIKQIDILKKQLYKDDTLIHLGNVGKPELLAGLDCHKVLIKGSRDTSYTKLFFDEVYEGPLWIAKKLILSHEPMCLPSVDNVPIAFNIHGHDYMERTYLDIYHLNLHPSMAGFYPLNLKKFINAGFLKSVDSIHRATIDKMIKKGE